MDASEQDFRLVFLQLGAREPLFLGQTSCLIHFSSECSLFFSFGCAFDPVCLLTAQTVSLYDIVSANVNSLCRISLPTPD